MEIKNVYTAFQLDLVGHKGYWQPTSHVPTLQPPLDRGVVSRTPRSFFSPDHNLSSLKPTTRNIYTYILRNADPLNFRVMCEDLEINIRTARRHANILYKKGLVCRYKSKYFKLGSNTMATHASQGKGQNYNTKPRRLRKNLDTATRTSQGKGQNLARVRARKSNAFFTKGIAGAEKTAPGFGSNLNDITKVFKSKGNNLDNQEKLRYPTNSVEMQIYNRWKEHGLSQHKSNKQINKTLLQIRRALRGTLYENARGNIHPKYRNKKFTHIEILKTISNFAKAALDDTYEPVNKTPLKNVSLGNFLYNPYAKVYKSFFLDYYENSPAKIPCGKFDVDYHPEITELLEKAIGEYTNFSIAREDRHRLKSVSARIVEFYKKNKPNIPFYFRDINDFPGWLVSAVNKRFNNPTIGNLDSNHTFQRTLPDYLRQQAIMLENDDIVNPGMFCDCIQ